MIVLGLIAPVLSWAQVSNPNADASIKAFNDAFLTFKDARTYYKRTLVDDAHDGTWTLALDIQGMQDAYERTGNPAHKTVVNDLCKSFLLFNPTPYSWDGWNDDLAWMALAMARGYQMTSTSNLLNAAESTFTLAFDRGWNTQFNNGGIWEQQPDMTDTDGGTNKEALSNNPMGQLACMLYQSTGKTYYLDRAKQIYSWSRSHLFNPATGQVYAGVYRNDFVNKSSTVYNQGTFIDFATLLYELTGDEMMVRDAQLAADYTIINFTTNGIITNTADYLNTWAAEFARGLGHLCKANPQLWNRYYPFLDKNAKAAWSNRRTDWNLTWNGWDQQTPSDANGIPTNYVSAVALHQFTPTLHPLTSAIEAEAYNYSNAISIETLTAGGKCINSNAEGDWIEYYINVPAAGNYTLTFSVASTAASFQVQHNHQTITVVDITSTGSLSTYATVSASMQLPTGIQSVRLKTVSGEWNLDNWSIKKCESIMPFISVNNAAATQTSTVAANGGDKISFTPQPADGTWSWSGPNNFTASSRTVTLNNIQGTNGGVYKAIYTSTDGCSSILDFSVSINGCTPTAILHSILANGVQTVIGQSIEAGSFVVMDPSPKDGTWNWIGPNGFTSTARQVSFNTITYKQKGDYTATYRNPSGCISTKIITISLTGADPCSSPITPYLNVDATAWKQTAFASVSAGGNVSIGPQPFEGTWSWTGPNGFTASTRDFTINDFSADKSGYYKATYTNEAGCITNKDFIIGLEGCASASIVPAIEVNGTPWLYADSIAAKSGDDIVITPPDIAGQWSWTGSGGDGEKWTGANGFTSDTRKISFENILSTREGTYTVTYVDAQACITRHAIDVFISGDDYCGTPIKPFINVNDEAWVEQATASLEVGDKFSVGPHPFEKSRWSWIGPDAFILAKREFTIENIQVAQGGVYKATATNNLGCRSYIDYIVHVNHDVVLGVHDRGEVSSLTVYPNPSADKIYVKDVPANADISVVDINGKTVIDRQATNRKEDVAIDITGIAAGMYFIKIGVGNFATLKFIKL